MITNACFRGIFWRRYTGYSSVRFEGPNHQTNHYNILQNRWAAESEWSVQSSVDCQGILELNKI